jgi:hypothetical protein
MERAGVSLQTFYRRLAAADRASTAPARVSGPYTCEEVTKVRKLARQNAIQDVCRSVTSTRAVPLRFHC